MKKKKKKKDNKQKAHGEATRNLCLINQVDTNFNKSHVEHSQEK